ncbi:MAG: GT2 family glycosyltransferase [Saprospiraceae bacterium]|jgi:GT2 family glycosyltransferase
MKLSVIIVNYNVKYFLEQALLSVRQACTNIDAEVFVVDNNSVDDSVEMVREKFQEVILIANKDNPGFSIANNQAIKLSKGEYVLLLNPDTVVEEDTFEKCIRFMDAHPQAGGLGVKMIDGSGRFLPESKRGFPAPKVAFYKTFGLSKLFPKSKTFNHYHLGYLDKDENHEVEVLAGAFMWLRKSVLDEVGLLDEAFFMYGEDIDLSYRIVKAGYKNYYFSDTTIIHYKGESTKKGSLNYVKTFYKAMIIFARKHFQGEQAWLFILMLQGAIYFRAFITLVSNFFRAAYLPMLDAALIFIGFYFLKDFWANYYFKDPDYYPASFLYFNIPLYICFWLVSVYFSGGYDKRSNIRQLVRGIFIGTVLLAAVYGFLDLEYRTSRILIILGMVWAVVSTIALRVTLHFLQYQNLNIGRDKSRNLVIVGTAEESSRVMDLLYQAEVQNKLIGTVAPQGIDDAKIYLSKLSQLDEVVHIYKINEVIFCSKDISAQDIMRWMTKIGADVEYKIVPKESLSIIGSSSKHSSGQLYTIDIRFEISDLRNRRNKRMLDLSVALLLLFFCPFTIWFVNHRSGCFLNIFKVLLAKKTWVAYIGSDDARIENLPNLRRGVLSPADGIKIANINLPTIQRLNFIYAKDYSTYTDLEIIWKGFKELGRH